MKMFSCQSSPLQLFKLSGGTAISTQLRPLLHSHEHLILVSPSKTRSRTCRTEAIASSFILAATSQPMSPDAPVLLQTGGLLIFTYWFFNFFVNDRISEFYGFDKVDGDEDSTDGSPSEAEEPPANGKATSTTKKQGFGNSKSKTKAKTKTKTKT